MIAGLESKGLKLSSESEASNFVVIRFIENRNSIAFINPTDN